MSRRPTVSRHDGWTRLSPPGNKLVARWRHEPSGFLVRHCGHPTANWPYYAEDPNDVRIIVTHNGRGFHTLLHAFELIEDLVAGRRGTVEKVYARDESLMLCIDFERRVQ